FLRCLNRLEEITGGHVYIEGVDITSPKIDINKIRQDVGMVFQQFNLFPHKSVLENGILAPMKVKKSDRKASEKKAYELLDKVGLREKAKAYPGELRSEERRVGTERRERWPTEQW